MRFIVGAIDFVELESSNDEDNSSVHELPVQNYNHAIVDQCCYKDAMFNNNALFSCSVFS